VEFAGIDGFAGYGTRHPIVYQPFGYADRRTVSEGVPFTKVNIIEASWHKKSIWTGGEKVLGFE
jgi:hypothetical protein